MRARPMVPGLATFTAPRTGRWTAAVSASSPSCSCTTWMPGVEAEVGGHHGRGEVAGDLGGERRADRRLVAQHRAGHPGVAARVGLEVVLDLADVALKAGAQRKQPRHLLGEELGRVRLGAVDARGAADHDRPDPRRALAGGEQLERPDHVDVVHRPARHPRARPADDLVVHHGVHLLLRDERRDHRVADVRLDEARALDRLRGPAAVQPGDVLELRVALRAAGRGRSRCSSRPR